VFFLDKLSTNDSPYASDEHVSLIANRFDETVKRTFRNAEDKCLIPFGSLFDKDPANGIVSGKLKLSGLVHHNFEGRVGLRADRLIDRQEVATFFEPAIAAAEKVIRELIKEANVTIVVCASLSSQYCTRFLMSHFHMSGCIPRRRIFIKPVLQLSGFATTGGLGHPHNHT
jgi:hypothetical protein